MADQCCRHDEALKYAELALAEAPDDANRKALTSMIERIKSKKDLN